MAAFRGQPKPLRLVDSGLHLDASPLPADAAFPIFRRCEVCAKRHHARRADALTCSARCRMARARGVGVLALAEVYNGRAPSCGCRRGLWVWTFRPAPGHAGAIGCTSCGVEQLVEVHARPWEAAPDFEVVAADYGEDLDSLTEAELVARFGHEMADEEDGLAVTDVTASSPVAG